MSTLGQFLVTWKVNFLHRAGNAYGNVDSSFRIEDWNPDAPHANFFFLVIDGVASFAYARELPLEPGNRDNRIFVMAQQALLAEHRFQVLRGQPGNEALAQGGAMQIHTLAEPRCHARRCVVWHLGDQYGLVRLQYRHVHSLTGAPHQIAKKRRCPFP
jgi:hypothetical protein